MGCCVSAVIRVCRRSASKEPRLCGQEEVRIGAGSSSPPTKRGGHPGQEAMAGCPGCRAGGHGRLPRLAGSAATRSSSAPAKAGDITFDLGPPAITVDDRLTRWQDHVLRNPLAGRFDSQRYVSDMRRDGLLWRPFRGARGSSGGAVAAWCRWCCAAAAGAGRLRGSCLPCPLVSVAEAPCSWRSRPLPVRSPLRGRRGRWRGPAAGCRCLAPRLAS